ncbi:hypothetical protein FisN_8Lh165 [Fistulifera solaris]|uniref:Uncharacterized protein n=1 Tax=Fistulifera solaris TaxID=1519565 RepID=A0A1Z5JDI0_FISSO|nr:hypothetical protein FisN_8Lh165 [Fistulifera solaris]|eukprot:GAX12063.1 hypothetical protein FisN_8Lh165 [Fistulifera solaris]
MLLTSIALAALLVGCEAKIGARKLSYQKIYKFTPKTQVTDHAAIDLDQQEIETLLTDQYLWSAAQAVYENGAHSKSYAEVTLSTPLTTTMAADVEISGVALDGTTVNGKIMEEAASGSSVIKVQYATSDKQEKYVGCQVGGSSEPVTTGCFADTGSLSMSGTTLDYTAVANKNARTIRGFSTNDARHRVESNPDQAYYKDMQMFVDYYGSSDYADKWIMAALANGSTGYSGLGETNFSTLDDTGRKEAVVKGTVFLAIFMYVIRELEDAIDDCVVQCDADTCNDDPVHALDEAVAFYTGSLHLTEGSDGNLLFSLAEKRCENFLTCENGEAAVNNRLFVLFNRMQNLLQQGKCEEAATVVSDITNIMYVPMIQGAFRYAYKSGEQDDQTPKSEAEGATFAAAVLPKVHKCNAADAQLIYDNMKVGNTEPVDWPAVKSAFERNYRCMGITCADVGGQSDGELYFEGAGPCSSSFMTYVGLALGLAAASLIAFF